jgi:hypothetical protein
LGDKKDFMYYMTKFGSLKRKEREFVSDFSKIFNKMYNKIPAEIKPIEASTKITYASAFDPNFCFLLRERRVASLAHMQDATLEVESNVLVLAQGKARDSTLQQRTKKTLTIDPFDNTCEADEVSPEVEAGVVVGFRCLQT